MLGRVKRLVLVGALIAPLFSLAASVPGYEDTYCDKDKQSDFLKTYSKLDCVSCGVERFNSGKAPSEKLLALMGVAAARYGMDSTSNGDSTTFETKSDNTAKSKQNFYQNVIQRVQALSFCTNISSYGKVTDEALLPYIANLITGSTSRTIDVKRGGKVVGTENSSGVDSKTAKKIANYLGFADEKSMASFFNDDKWRTASPNQRQENFFKKVTAARDPAKPGPEDNIKVNLGPYASEYGAGLKECLEQMRSKQSDSAFNLKSGTTKDSQDLCRLMASECGIEDKFCSQGIRDGAGEPVDVRKTGPPPVRKDGSAH
jgi:hypothetical protein